MTIMIPRLLLATILAFHLIFWLHILLLGHEEGTPITGCRKACLSFVYKAHAHMQAGLAFFTRVTWTNVSEDQVNNYEEYLGTV